MLWENDLKLSLKVFSFNLGHIEVRKRICATEIGLRLIVPTENLLLQCEALIVLRFHLRNFKAIRIKHSSIRTLLLAKLTPALGLARCYGLKFSDGLRPLFFLLHCAMYRARLQNVFL